MRSHRLGIVLCCAGFLGACAGGRQSVVPVQEQVPEGQVSVSPPLLQPPEVSVPVPRPAPAGEEPGVAHLPAPRSKPRPAPSSPPPPSPRPAASPATPPQESTAEVSPTADTRTAREHLVEALNALDRGESEGARGELEAARRQEPDNETASALLKQLDADPEEMLGRESFNYVTQAGDTLSKIAKKFLNDEHKFYILARYNGIARPRDLSVGQMLRIPGKKPAPAAKQQAPPKREPAPPQPKAQPSAKREVASPPPKSPGDDQAATVDSYYKKALSEFRKQNLDGAIQYCDKALEIDPDSERVKLLRAQALELNERIKKVPGKAQ